MTEIEGRLLKAAAEGDLATVSEALRDGAGVDAKDEYGNTSLNWAALRGHAEIVERLLEAGANLENPGSGGGLTPLANATSRGHFGLAQRLLDRGARVTDDVLSVLRTKVGILEEPCEGGLVAPRTVQIWTRVLEIFLAERARQDRPEGSGA